MTKKIWSNAKSKTDLKKLYLSLIPKIRQIAGERGYACGVHGSLTRDLDLILVPWIPRPMMPSSLLKIIQKEIALYKIDLKLIKRWHGRIACAIKIGTKAYIDISIITPKY